MFKPSNVAPAADPPSSISAQEADAAFSVSEPYRSLLLAVSGGSDSMALLHLVNEWRARHEKNVTFIVASIDHRLRSASAEECAFVAAVCASRDIPHIQLVWEGAKPVTGIQEAARNVRYKLLADCARANACQAIVTAHTLNDQAETVLMRLIRGSGLQGLQAMSNVSEIENLPLLRPFLHFEHERLRANLREASIAWCEDASNQDGRFLRPRLRKLMPLLEKEGLDSARLEKFAKKIARANAALDKSASDLFTQMTSQGLERKTYRLAPEEIRLRALKLMIASICPLAYPPADAALEDLDTALIGNNPIRRTLAGVIFSAGERYMRFKDENDPRQFK